MFGALRRLLQSGDLRGVLQESRRAFQDLVNPVGPTAASRQRALDEMNARGGVGNNAPIFPRRPAEEAAKAEGMPYNQYENTYFGSLPGGGYVTMNPTTGARATQRYGVSPMSTMASPYEGFRVLPGRVDSWGDTYVKPGPWQGRGLGPQWAEAPANGFDGADGSYWFNASRYGVNGVDMDTSVPRVFGGGTPLNPFPPLPETPPFIRGTVPFNDVMSARGNVGSWYSRPAPPSPGPGFFWDPVTQSWEIF